MRGSAHLTGLSRTEVDPLAAVDSPLARWLSQVARDVPAPEGDHGTLVFSVTVEWDHVKPLKADT